jgi:LuxR family maltose regulon positive regulatory protein
LQNLLAQAFYRYGDHAHALHHFKITIKFCEQHGLLRLLADEPWYINNMLNAFETSLCTAWKPYIDKLSTAISKNALDDSYQATPLILPNPLTPRETDLIKLVSEGCANKEIARLMTISENTVETHLKRINQKLETSNRTQAATKARELGAIQ